MNRTVIIDCDPGIDDALALLMAIASERLDVKGVTTVAGNVPVTLTSENARRIIALTDYDIPVAIGASKPLEKDLEHAAQVHGANGLGNVNLPETSRPFSFFAADHFIYEEAKKANGQLEIITLGPMTNIAQSFLKYPDLPQMIKKIWTMGGAMEGGNVTPCAEFNIYTDPHAAQVVFRSGVPIVMSGLDVTNRAVLNKENINKLGRLKSDVAQWMLVMLEHYAEFYRSIGFLGVAVHDPLAVASAIDPSIVATKLLPVDVETQGEFTMGCTIVDQTGCTDRKPNVDVAYGFDRDRFVDLVEELLSYYESGRN